MRFDLGRVLSRAFSISWRHRWLWILGVFGGGGAGYNFNGNTGVRGRGGNSAQFGHFIAQYWALILLVVLLVLLIAIVAFAISCVAVPGSIWAAVQLDAGREVKLGAAWRAGTQRGWRYFRLAMLKLLIGLAVVLVVFLFILLGVALYAIGRTAAVPLLILGGLLLFFAFIVAVVLISFGLLWSDRMLVLMDLGAADAIRAGWTLLKREKLNTVLFAVVFGVIKFVISLGVFLAAVIVAGPGIVMLVVFFASHAASTVLAILGIGWIVLFGFGALLVGGGYLGALNQVGYAIAARDLALGKGMPLEPEVIGWDPYASAPSPA